MGQVDSGIRLGGFAEELLSLAPEIQAIGMVDGVSYPDGGVFQRGIADPNPRTGTVTATLDNGDVLNTSFSTLDEGRLILVPEPATMGLLGLGGLALLKRRK